MWSYEHSGYLDVHDRLSQVCNRLQTLDEYFDIIFLGTTACPMCTVSLLTVLTEGSDADKASYKHYYQLILDRKLLHPTGLLIADNVLFRGQVALPPPSPSTAVADRTEELLHPAALRTLARR